MRRVGGDNGYIWHESLKKSLLLAGKPANCPDMSQGYSVDKCAHYNGITLINRSRIKNTWTGLLCALWPTVSINKKQKFAYSSLQNHMDLKVAQHHSANLWMLEMRAIWIPIYVENFIRLFTVWMLSMFLGGG